MKMPELVYLKKFIDLLHLRREKDYDNMIVLTGIKGSGKSTALYWIGKEYMRRIGREFDLNNHVIYSDNFDEIFTKIRHAQDGDYLWFDEGGRIILAEDWNSANSKRLKKMFSEIRTKHLCIGFAVPFAFTRIDAKYREALINFWIWVPIRGLAVVFEPIVHPTMGGFLEKEVEQKVKRTSWSYSLSNNYESWLLDSLKSVPSFLGSFKYVEIPKKEKEKYLKLRDEAVYSKKENDEEKANINYYKFIIYEIEKLTTKGLTVKEASKVLAKELNMNADSLRSLYYRGKKLTEALINRGVND